jgi:hypothetical protein
VELHYRDAAKLPAARALLDAGIVIADEEPTHRSLVMEVVG